MSKATRKRNARMRRALDRADARKMERALSPKTRVLTGTKAMLSIGGKQILHLGDVTISAQSPGTFEPYTLAQLIFAEEPDAEADAKEMERALAGEKRVSHPKVTITNIPIVFPK